MYVGQRVPAQSRDQADQEAACNCVYVIQSDINICRAHMLQVMPDVQQALQ